MPKIEESKSIPLHGTNHDAMQNLTVRKGGENHAACVSSPGDRCRFYSVMLSFADSLDDFLLIQES